MVITKIHSLLKDFKTLSNSLKASSSYSETIANYSSILTTLYVALSEFIITGEYISIGQTPLRRLINNLLDTQELFLNSIFELEANNAGDDDSIYSLTSYDIKERFLLIITILEKLDVIVSYHQDENALILLDPAYRTPLRNYRPDQDDLRSILRTFYEIEKVDYLITFLKHNPTSYLYTLFSLLEKIEIKTKDHQEILNLGITKILYLINKILILKNIDDIKLYVNKKPVSLREFEKDYYSPNYSDFIEIIKLNQREKLDSYDKILIDRLLTKYSSKSSLVNFLQVKLLKDFNANINDVSEFMNRIDRAYKIFENEKQQLKNVQNNFDSAAKKINIPFIGNNVISMCDEIFSRINSSQLNLSQEQYYHISTIVKNIQSELLSGIESKKYKNNYFTQFKYLCFLCEKTKYDIKNNYYTEEKEKEKEEIKQELINVLEHLIKTFYQMEVFQKYQFYIDDSFIEQGVFKIFVYSSINLPFNFKHEENRIEKVRFETYEIINQLNQLQARVELQKIEAQFDHTALVHRQDMQATITQTEKQVSSIGKKSTEILAIFSAIVIFSSGNIQLFNHITNLQSAIYIMFCFSFCVVSIFSLIHFSLSIKEGDGFKSAMWRHFGLLIITGLIMASLFFVSTKIKFDGLNKLKNDEAVRKSQ